MVMNTERQPLKAKVKKTVDAEEDKKMVQEVYRPGAVLRDALVIRGSLCRSRETSFRTLPRPPPPLRAMCRCWQGSGCHWPGGRYTW